MPSYKGHLAGGAAAYVITLAGVLISTALDPSLFAVLEWFALCMIGSLFPDVDIKSKGQKLFYMILLATMIILSSFEHWHALVFLSFMAVIPLCSKHRGLFHNLWFVVLLPITISWLICIFWLPHCSSIIFYDCLFFISGAISHLYLDLGFRRLFR